MDTVGSAIQRGRTNTMEKNNKKITQLETKVKELTRVVGLMERALSAVISKMSSSDEDTKPKLKALEIKNNYIG